MQIVLAQQRGRYRFRKRHFLLFFAAVSTVTAIATIAASVLRKVSAVQRIRALGNFVAI